MSTQSTLTQLREYFQLGARLANQAGVSQEVRKRIPEAAQRTVQVKVLRPRPEVAQYLPDWLKLYAEDRLKEGAVQEESFSLYLDPLTNQIQVTDPWRIPDHTVTFLVEENTCWMLASRKETVYTAYQKGLPMRVKGDFIIRDMELVDEILDLFYRTLQDQNMDLAQLLGGV